MGVLETYFHYRNSGMTLVENASSSPDELRALGADANDAAELARLHRVYFGPPALVVNNAKPAPPPKTTPTDYPLST